MDNKTFYEKYDWSALKEPALRPKIEQVLKRIPEEVKTIVDIGCGNGVITNVLGEHYQVTAVDRSEHALSYVTTKKVLASADKIPLPDHSFDLVFSSELLEHLEDEVFRNTIREMKRLSKKYIFITVPNEENPDKLAIRCPNCGYDYNSPLHLRKIKMSDFADTFPEYNIVDSLTFGTRVRYYNSGLLSFKKKLSPASSWIPNYWMPKNKRATSCPKCEHEFENTYKFNPVATGIDLINVVISPKKPYWLFILMEKK